MDFMKRKADKKRFDAETAHIPEAKVKRGRRRAAGHDQPEVWDFGRDGYRVSKPR